MLGLAILSQDLLGFHLGLDQALMRGDSAGTARPEELRLAPGVTGLLIIFGLALLYAKQGGITSAFSQILALMIIGQILIVLAGYAYGVQNDYYAFPFAQMSMYGAICGLLLGLGLLAASPEYGIGAAIVEQSPAGEMLRRLLPGIIVLPLVIGWFAHLAEIRTLNDSAATLAIFAVASIFVLALFAWTTIGAVRRADRDRNAALMELRGQREWLSTTLASIGDGVIATDPNGSVLLLNKIAEQLTGWSGAKARGRPIWEVFRVINESTRKPVDDPALKALRERAVTRFEFGRPSRHPRQAGAAGRALRRADHRLRRLARRRRAHLPRRHRAQAHRAAPVDARGRAQSPRQECARHRAVAGAGEPAPGDLAGRRKPWRRRSPSASRRSIAPTTFCSNRNGRARASRPWWSASSIRIGARAVRRS